MKLSRRSALILVFSLGLVLFFSQFMSFNISTFEKNYNTIVDQKDFIDFDKNGRFDIQAAPFVDEINKETTCQFLDVMFPPLFIGCEPIEEKKATPITSILRIKHLSGC